MKKATVTHFRIGRVVEANGQLFLQRLIILTTGRQQGVPGHHRKDNATKDGSIVSRVVMQKGAMIDRLAIQLVSDGVWMGLLRGWTETNVQKRNGLARACVNFDVQLVWPVHGLDSVLKKRNAVLRRNACNKDVVDLAAVNQQRRAEKLATKQTSIVSIHDESMRRKKAVTDMKKPQLQFVRKGVNDGGKLKRIGGTNKGHHVVV